MNSNHPALRRNIPELLAPAGNMAALEAAIGRGCDAVYFGVGAQNARGAAGSFERQDLDAIMRRCALADVKAYLTLNTLLADDELDEALELAGAAAAAGVHAVILQDKGLALALRRYYPELALHGSTQMTLSHAEALYEARDMGLSRVILPRELRADELAELCALARHLGMESEAFVQGALCVCVSGQCGLSHANGGRSANRGACAQPCRLDYRLQIEGQSRPAAPLLSPKDLSLLPELPALLAGGLDSLKIEGRRRSPAYVAAACTNWRLALDAAAAGIEFDSARAEQELLLAFNRGGAFTQAWFKDERTADFLSGDWVGSHGLLLGWVVESDPREGWLYLREAQPGVLSDELLPGTVLSVRDHDEGKELASAPIGKLRSTAGLLAVKAFHPQILRQFEKGQTVFLARSQRLEKMSLEFPRARRRTLNFKLAQLPEEAKIRISADSGDFCRSLRLDEQPAYEALPAKRAQKALSKLGATPFLSGAIQVEGEVRLPLAELNAARRRLADELAEQIVEAGRRRIKKQVLDLDDFTDLVYSGLAKRNHAEMKAFPRQRTRFYLQDELPEKEELKSLQMRYDGLLIPLGLLFRRPELAEELRRLQFEFSPVLPPLAARENWEQARALLAELSRRQALELRLPTAGGAGWSETHEGLSWGQDCGGQMMNSLSALWAFARGARTLYPSEELSLAGLKKMSDKLASFLLKHAVPPAALPYLELAVSGPQRVMYSRFCPLGHRKRGCRACRNKHAALLPSDRPEAKVLNLVFRPELDCCTELLAGDEEHKRLIKKEAESHNWALPLSLRYNQDSEGNVWPPGKRS